MASPGIIWMKLEGQTHEKISAHAWYVVPTLPIFVLFTFFYPHTGFWLTLLIYCAITVVLFTLWALLLKRFGIMLI